MKKKKGIWDKFVSVFTKTSNDIIALDKLKSAIQKELESGKSPKHIACAVLPEFYGLMEAIKDDFPADPRANEIINKLKEAIESGSTFLCN